MIVDPLRHIRRLTAALIISGALNVILMGFVFYWLAVERLPKAYLALKPANMHEQQAPLAIDHSNSEVIRFFRKMSIEWLVSRLSNTQLVENGYTQRDLALAILVDFHHFDIEKAFSGLSVPDQRRTIVYGKYRNGSHAELVVFPSLSDHHFEAIQKYARTEKWPLSSKGLFLALRKADKEHPDPSLSEAFYMTQEFLAVEVLFERGGFHLDRNELLQVLLQGDWPMLSNFAAQQKASQDLSAARRQRFLLDYIQKKSKAATYLMLKTDQDIAVRKLDDNHVILLLDLLEDKTVESEQFALLLLTSPRSDAVWHKAASRLYAYAGEAMPEKYHHHAALSRFVPQHTVVQSIDPASTPAMAPSPQIPPPKTLSSAIAANKTAMNLSKNKPSTLASARTPAFSGLSKRGNLYIVQEGDSLWKISRRFHVEVEEIKSYNKLDSDFLRPGKPLRIP